VLGGTAAAGLRSLLQSLADGRVGMGGLRGEDGSNLLNHRLGGDSASGSELALEGSSLLAADTESSISGLLSLLLLLGSIHDLVGLLSLALSILVLGLVGTEQSVDVLGGSLLNVAENGLVGLLETLESALLGLLELLEERSNDGLGSTVEVIALAHSSLLEVFEPVLHGLDSIIDSSGGVLFLTARIASERGRGVARVSRLAI